MEVNHIKKRSATFQHGDTSTTSPMRKATVVSGHRVQDSFSSSIDPSTQVYSTYTPMDMTAPAPCPAPREAQLPETSPRWRSSMNKSFTEGSSDRYGDFAKKMDYFRSKGSISLAAPSHLIPSWKESDHSSLLSSKMLNARYPKVVFFFVVMLTSLTVLLVFGRHVFPQEAEQTFASSIGGLFPKHYPRFLTCEPYSTFGTLTVDQIDPDETQWRPFDKTCEPPQFFRKLRHGETKDMNWIHNRTVLLIGDTIEREHVEQFCKLMGRSAETVTEGNQWSGPPSSFDRYSGRSGKFGRGRNSRKGAKEGSLPRVCYIPEYNFVLASVYHFGLDQDDFWSQSEIYTAPGVFEQRLSEDIEPFVKKLVRERGGRLDLLELSSGSWDLMRWAKQDAELGQSTVEPLTPERVTWYRFRAGQIMEAVRKAFPSARGKLWRGLHFPSDQAAELEYFQDHIGISKAAQKEPPHFSLNRVAQLDQAVKSLVASPKPNTIHQEQSDVVHPEYRLNPWGTLMMGHPAHQPDRLHGPPGAPATTLWSEIMLYELFRAVLVQKEQS